jgi:DNA-binding NarL/FixJ family response regulator
MGELRLFLCDDHDLVRTALARALAALPDLAVVGEASNAADLQRLLAQSEPDVLVLDLNIGEGGAAGGVALVERLRARHPNLPVLVLSMHDDAEVVSRVLHAGAHAFVTKGSPLESLREAIVQVGRGRRYIDPSLVPSLVGQRPEGSAWDAVLSPREREVMARLCAGQRLSEIAATLSVSIKTVSTHKMRLMEKLQVRNNAELIRLGQKHGLV